MAVGSTGKSGSVRVLYVLAHADKIYLVLAYAKSVKDSLTDEKIQVKTIGSITQRRG
ncbi:type II toxin-antitoxin system RelE/ParE family toxin [Shewanella dokdonensis]|uniref:type II toxin-antitoxin system RelE/ParE family toxin n=1 Tax=Shewanella dokdonensis TaxID=712036 RepID=UPI001FD5E0E9|nr:type II toxin-antitoxin system RelE/ParE family toxin [Shewanella dokdonensis]